MFTAWQRWLRKCASIPSFENRQKKPRRRSCLPCLEPLEDRCLPSSYATIDLGSGTAYDLNNFGQVVGTMGVLNWQTGTITGPAGSAINDAGHVAGGSSGAFLWDPSTGFTNLGYLPGDNQSKGVDLNLA